MSWEAGHSHHEDRLVNRSDGVVEEVFLRAEEMAWINRITHPLLLSSKAGCTWLLLVTLAGMGEVAAGEIYRTVDENGVVGFSDVSSEGAVRMEIPETQVSEERFVRQQAVIDQQLAVARSLEESRLAREAARIRRLEALAAARPDTVIYQQPVETRYAGGVYRRHWRYWPGYGRPIRPGHPGKPGHPANPVHPIASPAGGGHSGSRVSQKLPMLPLNGKG
jgi:hypothetical protein